VPSSTLLAIIAVLLGAILVVLCALFVIVLKAANQTITGLQSLFDEVRKGRSP
jgi:hypothetical protein